MLPTRSEEGTAFEALQWLYQGVLFLDSKGSILFANRAAEEILSAQRGLRRANGSLHAERAEEIERLHALIAVADGAPGGAIAHPVAFSRRDAHLPLIGFVLPLARSADQEPAAILFLTDPDCEYRVREDALQLQFGLTRAEIAIALAILRGDGLAAAARRLGVFATTARTHLDNVFRKTGTRRQAQLVRLILQSCCWIRPLQSSARQRQRLR
jgi:DNA-binding CsgD family transcriptional regulator